MRGTAKAGQDDRRAVVEVGEMGPRPSNVAVRCSALRKIPSARSIFHTVKNAVVIGWTHGCVLEARPFGSA